MGVMRTEPQPSDREVLAGLVERVTYQNAENGFCVIRVKARASLAPDKVPADYVVRAKVDMYNRLGAP